MQALDAKLADADAVLLINYFVMLNLTGIIGFVKDAVPYIAVIIIGKRRDYVRKAFTKNNVFCPVHWPWVSEDLNGRNVLYESELSLVCNQRYSEDDMKFILEILESEYKN